MSRTRLEQRVADVVGRDTCSGCGACTLLDPGLEMQLDARGWLRPARRPGAEPLGATADRAAVRAFDRACPGLRVDAPTPAGSVRDPVLGPVVRAWEAWAADPEVRREGSSGGVLTALAAWLVSTGEAAHVVGARQSTGEPRRTVSVRLTTREEALATAGSRYAPTASAGVPGALDPDGAFIGKPCEASAVRRLTEEGPAPLVLSFFCAGTPSQEATGSLLETLGVARDEPLTSLRYRGDGWPGTFAARTASGRVATTSYDDSWGAHLGPAVQWRCKLCPDGVGESSDITAADVWRADEHGYPVFTEGDGISALVARTERGVDVVERAAAAGVLVLRPLDLRHLTQVQPLQRRRRTLLLGRIVGALAAGRRPPRYRGFGLLRFALREPRQTVRQARGTFRRARRDR